jgi:hypothetical protein
MTERGIETPREGEKVTIPRQLVLDVLWLLGAQNYPVPDDARGHDCFLRVTDELRAAIKGGPAPLGGNANPS